MLIRYLLFALLLLGAPGRSQNSAGGVYEPKAVTSESDDFFFDIQPRVIAAGDAALLRWSIKGATQAVIEEASESSRELHKLGTFGGSGSLQVRPKENTTYVISCERSTTYSCASVTVRVRVKQR